jgi:hypothetical protein
VVIWITRAQGPVSIAYGRGGVSSACRTRGKRP